MTEAAKAGSTFDTDKILPHAYFQTYAGLAAELGPRTNVCEVGIWRGEGLRMFQALFPLGEITGVDQHATAGWPPGTHQVVSAQDDTGLPAKLNGTFGLVVDDASHQVPQTWRTFDMLWPLVEPGGYYVIEDWFMNKMAQGLDSLVHLVEGSNIESVLFKNVGIGLILIHKA